MGGLDYQAECPDCGAMLPTRHGRATCPVCGAALRAKPGGAETASLGAGEPEAWEDDEERRPLRPPHLAGEREGPMVICCAREQKVNPLDVGPLVEGFTGLSRRDALTQVTRGMGILAVGVGPDSAEAMVEALAEHGVEAYAFPMPAEPPVARKLKISRIYGADEEALHVQTDASGAVKTMPWSKLTAGMCTQERFGRGPTRERQVERRPVMYSAGFGMPAVAWRTVRKTTRRMDKPKMRVTLVLRDESGRAYLMPFGERQVRYAYLGERIKTGSAQNLSVFLSDVLRWGSPAFFPAGFRAAAQADAHHVTRLVGKRDAENYLRWTLCCAAAQGLFAADR